VLIQNYASAKAVCGRAGLFPSHYQSDEVDRTGKLTRFRNAKLRSPLPFLRFCLSFAFAFPSLLPFLARFIPDFSFP